MGPPQSSNAFSAKMEVQDLVDFWCGPLPLESHGKVGCFLGTKMIFFLMKGRYYSRLLCRRSQGQFGALTCVNSCTWLLKFVESTPRSLHVEVKVVTWCSKFCWDKNGFQCAKKTKFDTAQGKRIGSDYNGNPFGFLRGHGRPSSLLGTSQYFMWTGFKSFEGHDCSFKAGP